MTYNLIPYAFIPHRKACTGVIPLEEYARPIFDSFFC